jgi:hypothetical protein
MKISQASINVYRFSNRLLSVDRLNPVLSRIGRCHPKDRGARVVESWPRVTSKRISADVRAVAQGTFDFSRLEPLMAVSDQEEGEDEA